MIRNDPHGPLLKFLICLAASLCVIWHFALLLGSGSKLLPPPPRHRCFGNSFVAVGHTNSDRVLYHYYPLWCMLQLNPATFSVQRGRLISSQIKSWPRVLTEMSESLLYFNKHWKASILFCSEPSSVILRHMHRPNMAVQRGKEMASLDKGEDGGRKETYCKV